MTISLAQQAAVCRAQAGEFAGKPEQAFLLRLSEAFEDLAREQNLTLRGSSSSKQTHREAI
jgi:hypothetical protein